jgi:hypothetical protein
MYKKHSIRIKIYVKKSIRMVQICITITYKNKDIYGKYIREPLCYVTSGKKLQDGSLEIKHKNERITVYTGCVNIDLLKIIMKDTDIKTIYEEYAGMVISSVTTQFDKNDFNINESSIRPLPEFIMKAIVVRYVEHLEYERVVKYAIASSKIQSKPNIKYDFNTDLNTDSNTDPCSDLLQFSEIDFDLKKFHSLFPLFDKFLNETSDLDLMISGSSTLYALRKFALCGRPADLDIYMHKNQDQAKTLKKLDEIIRKIYNEPFEYEYKNIRDEKKTLTIDRVKIHLVRSPYILSWMVVSDIDEPELKEIQNKKRYIYENEQYNMEKSLISCCLIVSFQVILSPCADWSHVFAGYHSDIVCTGYLTKQKQFVVTPRFMHYYNGNTYKTLESYFPELKNLDKKIKLKVKDNSNDMLKNKNKNKNNSVYNVPRIAYFIKDFVSPRYRDRVDIACLKYAERGLLTTCIDPFDDIIMADVARSETPWNESYFSKTNFALTDICPTLVSILNKEGVMKVSETLVDVYQGEMFRSIIEIMACFQACPMCGVLVFNARNSLYCDIGPDKKEKVIYDKGCICDECFKKEVEKMLELKTTLKTLDTKNRALVTGGRCGLGQKVLQMLKENGVNAVGTTRFPSGSDGLIKLDLKNHDTFGEVKCLLETGQINFLILSASETLHYPSDDELSKNWNKNNKDNKDDKNNKDNKDNKDQKNEKNIENIENKKFELDWTNDFKRENTGVWHKCLNEHSLQEIISPLMTNVAGNAILLASFLNGVKKMRAFGSKNHYCCVVVTSFEGAFIDKTPFHPITNACKSALEQIVFTVKAQADFLDTHVLLADPLWVFTESTYGKFKGPVPIDFGACHILEPMIQSINGTAINGKLIHNSLSNHSIYGKLDINDEFIPKDLPMTNNDNDDYNSNVNRHLAKSNIKSFKIKLRPCGHIVNQDKDGITWCPICKKLVNSRKLISDITERKKDLLMYLLQLPTVVIEIIFNYEQTN